MNFKILEPQKPEKFKPFKIEIDIETIEDLAFIYGAFNASLDEISDNKNKTNELSGIEIKNFPKSFLCFFQKLIFRVEADNDRREEQRNFL